MYTQCPDCEVAFKVTAEDLKQAGGEVSCRGCGKPFSALSNLSETMPVQPEASKTDEMPPEPAPKITDTGRGRTEGISLEESVALLKSLDELAGSDIRILDTGIEWRVLDGEEAGAATESPDEELRFDDNTPLPEDFGGGDEASHPAESNPSYDPVDEDDEPDLLDEEPEPGIALSEPDEWKDLLGEFMDLANEVATPIDGVDPAVNAENDGDDDTEIHFADVADDEPASGTTPDETPDEESEEELLDDLDEESEEELPDELDLNAELEQLDMIEVQADLEEEPAVEGHSIEVELSGEHNVPPMTEEEHTANLQIDQDLMALAVEDEDGFISTIVVAEENKVKKPLEQDGIDGDDEFSEEPSAATTVETIIMEGDTIRTAIESEEIAEAVAAALEPLDIPPEDETGQSTQSEESQRSGGASGGLIAAAVLLMLTLGAQIVHQSRESLATIPAINGAIAQIYRVIGQPVQPAWDIAGWRFEATKGSTEGDNEDLTVYSRIGNNSAGPLPYPLIGISLTDRFEETIGSRVLDPAEYLPSDLDPRKLVAQGDTFNAVITIKSASEDATGFKLNVCYRLTDGRLRCAIDDFK